MKPSAVMIGLPVYNGARYLNRALDALLSQSYSKFHVIALDDGSSDESYTILEDYACRDSRISIFRNTQRTGLIAAWNKVARLAGEGSEPKFFAWYSDHDWVTSNWLEQLLLCLRNDPSAVLATVPTCEIDENGKETGVLEPALHTADLDPYDAIRSVSIDDFRAGNAVYGLFRYSSLKNFGFLPEELLPDRLLVSGMVDYGLIRATESALRYRRIFVWNSSPEEVIQRQVRTLFGSQGAPVELLRFSHATYFFRQLFLQKKSVNLDLDGSFRQLSHAYLYFIDQFNSQKEQWKQELTAAESGCSPETMSLVRFAGFIADKRWLPIGSSVLRQYLFLAKQNKLLKQSLKSLQKNLKP